MPKTSPLLRRRGAGGAEASLGLPGLDAAGRGPAARQHAEPGSLPCIKPPWVSRGAPCAALQAYTSAPKAGSAAWRCSARTWRGSQPQSTPPGAPRAPLPLCTSPPGDKPSGAGSPAAPMGGPHLLATQQPQTQGAAGRLQHPKRTVGRDTHPDTGPGWLRLLFPCPPLHHEQEQRQGELTAAAPPLTCASGESLGAAQPLKQAPLRSEASVGGCSARLWDFLPPPPLPFLFFFFFFRSVLNVQMPQLLKIQPGGVGSVLELAQAVCSVRARC